MSYTAADLNSLRQAAGLIAEDLRRTTNCAWECDVDESRQLTLRVGPRAASAHIQLKDDDALSHIAEGAVDRDVLHRHRHVEEVANAAQSAIKHLHASWPHCPAHPAERMTVCQGDWMCWRGSSAYYHKAAPVGQLNPDPQMALATVRKQEGMLVKRLWEHKDAPLLYWGDDVRLELDTRPALGAAVRSLWTGGLQINMMSKQQFALASSIIIGIASTAPGHAFAGLGIPSRWNYNASLALALGILLLLLFAPIAVSVAVPLTLAWAGIFSQTEAAATVLALLVARAVFTPSFLCLVAPRSVRTGAEADAWEKDHPWPARFRLVVASMGLFAVPFFAASQWLPDIRRMTETWALRHGADVNAAFSAVCVAGMTGILGLVLIGRRWRDWGESAADGLFADALWVLLIVLLVLVPVVLHASWAPIMLAATVVPLLAVRVRTWDSVYSTHDRRVVSWVDDNPETTVRVGMTADPEQD